MHVSYSMKKSFVPLCNLQTYTNSYSIHDSFLEVSWGQRCLGKILESLLDFVFSSKWHKRSSDYFEWRSDMFSFTVKKSPMTFPVDSQPHHPPRKRKTEIWSTVSRWDRYLRQAGDLLSSRNWDPPQSAIWVELQEKFIGRMYWTYRRPMVLYQNLSIYPKSSYNSRTCIMLDYLN